jgi:hypothetical protein
MSRKPILTLVAALLFAIPLGAAEPKLASRSLSLSVGKTIRLQMSKKQVIRTVVVDRDGILRIVPALDDPASVLVTGLAPGKVRVVLTAENGDKMAVTFGQ